MHLEFLSIEVLISPKTSTTFLSFESWKNTSFLKIKVYLRLLDDTYHFFAKEGIIGYATDEQGVSHANTLLHEILHAIIYQWNIDLGEKAEEHLVNGLTNGLTTIFVDNPQLLDYLKTKIKEG